MALAVHCSGLGMQILLWALALGPGSTVSTGVTLTTPWKKVFVEDGMSALFPCTINSLKLEVGRASHHVRTSASWTREEGNAKTILSVLPNGRLVQGRWIVPRASIQRSLFPQGNFSLRIHPVRYEDAGHYIGKIQYGEARQQCHLLLHVIRVTATPSDLLPPGVSAILSCASTDPAPPVEVCWYQDGKLRSCSQKYQAGWRALRLQSVSEADEGEWRCEHRYQDGSRPQAGYHLKVQGILEAGSDLLTIYATEASDVKLPCILKHSPRGDISVCWTQTTTLGITRTILLSESEEHGRISMPVNQKLDYSLSISTVWETDAGHYTCGLTSQGRSFIKHIRLVVAKVLPETPGLTREGTVVRLNCILSEVTGAEQYNWTLSASNVKREESKAGHSERELMRRQLNGQTLELTPVSHEDAGTWVCTIYARNKMIAKATYALEITEAQHSGPPFLSGGKISLVVVLTVFILLVLTAVTVLALRNRRRRLFNFSALENAGDRSLIPSKYREDMVEQNSMKQAKEDP
ncbi:lymphocyte activation gene 3 protein [Ambystoma mexicanum]|uniref:lymphocyte activation gene 3 protein n=1 Tax=Ambystoma mexicanum TaxID=8296 RepID=UPI0037E7A44A